MKVVNLNNMVRQGLIKSPSREVAPGQSVINTFSEAMSKALGNTNDLLLKADELTEKLATGEETSIHKVMVGVTKAELALQFVLELRNKLTEIYKELSRMPV